MLLKKNIGIEVRFQIIVPRQYNKLFNLRISFLIRNLLFTLLPLYILRSTERRRIKAINELNKLNYFPASTILSHFRYGIEKPETMNGQ